MTLVPIVFDRVGAPLPAATQSNGGRNRAHAHRPTSVSCCEQFGCIIAFPTTPVTTVTGFPSTTSHRRPGLPIFTTSHRPSPRPQVKLDLSPEHSAARSDLLREAFFPNWKDAASSSGLDHPDEMQKKDPLGTQIWKLYSKTKTQLPNQERMENLTWRMMAMNLKRQEREQARSVSALYWPLCAITSRNDQLTVVSPQPGRAQNRRSVRHCTTSTVRRCFPRPQIGFHELGRLHISGIYCLAFRHIPFSTGRTNLGGRRYRCVSHPHQHQKRSTGVVTPRLPTILGAYATSCLSKGPRVRLRPATCKEDKH